jgi:hypothetical protein
MMCASMTSLGEVCITLLLGDRKKQQVSNLFYVDESVSSENGFSQSTP